MENSLKKAPDGRFYYVVTDASRPTNGKRGSLGMQPNGFPQGIPSSFPATTIISAYSKPAVSSQN
jgi:hypothetical protein